MSNPQPDDLPPLPPLPEASEAYGLPAPDEDPDADLFADAEPEVEPAAPVGPSLLVRCAAELFGTFVLVFAGVGVGIYGSLFSAGPLAGALAFGLAVIAGAAVVGHISGAHFNSAITLGMAVGGRLPWRDVLPYWLSQVVGGALAAALLYLTVPSGLSADGARGVIGGAANGFEAHSPLGVLAAANNVDVHFTIAAALLVEVVLTGVLVAVALGATRPGAKAAFAPYAIGLTLALGLLIAGPVTNGSLNPARSTATAIFGPTWALSQLWLFWVAPLLGAAVAALLYRAFAPTPVELPDEDDEGTDEPEELEILPR